MGRTSAMVPILKKLINGTLRYLGLRLVRISPPQASVSEPGLHAILRQLGVSVVFDVGAHVGEFGNHLRSIGYQGRIISFEPQAAAFAALYKKAMLDPYWEASHLALSDRAGEQVLNISRNSWSSSFLPVLPNVLDVEPGIGNVGTERVKVEALDSFFKKLINPEDKIFLKIDAQGYEPTVLAGAREFLSCCVGVQLEMALLPSYQNQTLLPEMIAVMRKNGFELVHLERGFWDDRTGYLMEADGIFVRAEILKRDVPRNGGAVSGLGNDNAPRVI
jgi:FkbM family methyltransferase